MDSLRKRNIIVISIILYCLSSCNTGENSSIENCSMQPTEGYPFITNMEEITSILKYRGLDTISFKSGEIIADIGAGNGYIEAILSMFHDSLTFYIQDIDKSVCNQSAIDEVVDFYQEVNGKPFTNRFIVVNGTDTDTNLPDSIFNKILMLWTYQYLKEPRVFIKDVRDNMKDDGLFYVINPQLDEDEYMKLLRQKYGWNVSPLEKQITDIIDCGFELVRISRNYDVGEYNEPFVMVFKKKLTKP